MIQINKSTGKYAQCNFCLSKTDIYKLSSNKLNLVVSVCAKCLEEIKKGYPER